MKIFKGKYRIKKCLAIQYTILGIFCANWFLYYSISNSDESLGFEMRNWNLIICALFQLDWIFLGEICYCLE